MLTNKVINSRYVGVTVAIDGIQFENCVFEKCILEYSGSAPISFTGCTFISCEWSLVGPAANTLQFMRTLYNSDPGARQLIEQILQSIRTSTPEPQKVKA
jgi:hypothetical protein